MNELLEKITAFLKSELETKKVLNLVHTMTDAEIPMIVRENQFPLLAVAPIGEEYITASIADFKRMRYDIKLRLIFRGDNFNKQRIKNNNIFQVSEYIRQLLLSNQTLDGSVWGMDEAWAANDFNIIDGNKILFVARDIYISYFKEYSTTKCQLKPNIESKLAF